MFRAANFLNKLRLLLEFVLLLLCFVKWFVGWGLESEEIGYAVDWKSFVLLRVSLNLPLLVAAAIAVAA